MLSDRKQSPHNKALDVFRYEDKGQKTERVAKKESAGSIFSNLLKFKSVTQSANVTDNKNNS